MPCVSSFWYDILRFFCCSNGMVNLGAMGLGCDAMCWNTVPKPVNTEPATQAASSNLETWAALRIGIIGTRNCSAVQYNQSLYEYCSDGSMSLTWCSAHMLYVPIYDTAKFESTRIDAKVVIITSKTRKRSEAAIW